MVNDRYSNIYAIRANVTLSIFRILRLSSRKRGFHFRVSTLSIIVFVLFFCDFNYCFVFNLRQHIREIDAIVYGYKLKPYLVDESWQRRDGSRTVLFCCYTYMCRCVRVQRQRAFLSCNAHYEVEEEEEEKVKWPGIKSQMMTVSRLIKLAPLDPIVLSINDFYWS